ncbi:BTB POZ domain-containing 9 isoform A [Micractinium conductrix]|uniref:BTB POZ domain-containing 9 isoform A n=1 Tax=Micractinium conductrix TaxID=554055 RepID=A0A2P6V6U0_9CHLO|nr:BTB POZ domain-containing 9 isoform A [Micractinium conductrix]|eukprot:PSC69803.1 BTB POZ domain-containing 9 isoform A [Micractinium conductrix]
MLPPFAAYCEADPSASYLAGDEFLLASADAVFLVEGVGLPVHMVLLEERCGALTGGKLTGGVSADVVHFSQGRALKVVMSDLLPESSRSLAGYTLKRVVHFLRFLYHPQEVGDSGQPQAHLQRLLDWCEVADKCGLTRLWTKCVREVAVTLARARMGVSPRSTSQADLSLAVDPSAEAAAADGTKTAVHDVALLRNISPRAQLAVMATLLASLRKVAGDPSTLVPTEASLAASLPALVVPESPPTMELA